MFKIENIICHQSIKEMDRLKDIFEGLEFNVTVSQANSRQLNSNIDECIRAVISKNYDLLQQIEETEVYSDGNKFGELDLVFEDDKSIKYYMEIEKSNKKTLWFDFIKILTKLTEDSTGYGVVLCPVNYAHKVGVWNIFKEAITYKSHLKRVFKSDGLDRVGVIGYTQYAYLDNAWVEFDSSTIAQIKEVCLSRN